MNTWFFLCGDLVSGGWRSDALRKLNIRNFRVGCSSWERHKVAAELCHTASCWTDQGLSGMCVCTNGVMSQRPLLASVEVERLTRGCQRFRAAANWFYSKRTRSLLEATRLQSILFNILIMVEDQLFSTFFNSFSLSEITLLSDNILPRSAHTFNEHPGQRHVKVSQSPACWTELTLGKMHLLDITTVTNKHYNSYLTIPRNIAGNSEEIQVVKLKKCSY